MYFYAHNVLRFAGVALLALALTLSGCADSETDKGAETSGKATQVNAEEPVETAMDEAADSDTAGDSSVMATMEEPVEPVVEEEPPDSPEMPPHEGLSVEYGTYTVQIGSYDSREKAQPFMDKLAAEGLEPYLIDEVVNINGEDRLVYRLRFGKYDTKDEAHNRGSEVALRYELDYWVDNYKH